MFLLENQCQIDDEYIAFCLLNVRLDILRSFPTRDESFQTMSKSSHKHLLTKIHAALYVVLCVSFPALL